MTREEKIEVLNKSNIGVRHIRDDIYEVKGQEKLWISDNAIDQAYAWLTREISIDDLLARGAQQTSRKYRSVACLPPGMTGLQALKEHAPDHYREVMQHAESMAASRYRTYVAQKHGNHYELTVPQFNEFLVKTGRRPHTFLEKQHTPCRGCGSFGHQHRKECPEQQKETGSTSET